MTPPDTGFPDADAEMDFEREWRRRAIARIAARLRFQPDDTSVMLPFEDVVAALGRVSETDLGLQVIPLDSIVGTVDRASQTFDRSFRPASHQIRGRWQRIAAARRRGVAMPPIDVYRMADMHFVRDGHHRVSVARALGESTIEARVREVRTAVGADRELRLGDLPLKRHERSFQERVPLAPQERAHIELSDEWRYAHLATLIEAWGFRASHARGELLSREEMADLWFHGEYEPIVKVLREAGVGGEGTEAERYLRFALLRYLLLNALDWSDEVVERLLGEVRPPQADDDTLVHQILKEMT